MSETEAWKLACLLASGAAVILLVVAAVLWRTWQDERTMCRLWESRAELYHSMWEAADEVLWHVMQAKAKAKASQEDEDPADYWKRGGKPFGED